MNKNLSFNINKNNLVKKLKIYGLPRAFKNQKPVMDCGFTNKCIRVDKNLMQYITYQNCTNIISDITSQTLNFNLPRVPF